MHAKKKTTPGIIAGVPTAETSHLKKPRIKLVASDIGHVLVDFVWQDVIDGFAERLGLSVAQYRSVLKHIGTLGFENGDIDTVGVVAELNEQVRKLGIEKGKPPLTVDEFNALWCKGFHENPSIAAILQETAKSTKLWALSNTNESHWDFIVDSLRVDRHFAGLILSYVVRASKPRDRIYECLFEQSGHAPDECVFIDDLAENIETARRLGMHVIHFRDAADLRARLIALEVLSN